MREDWLWPTDAALPAIGRRPGCTLINRSTEPTIYPPAAEAWFAGVYRVAGIESRHKAWQVAGLGVDLATVWLLLAGAAPVARRPAVVGPLRACVRCRRWSS